MAIEKKRLIMELAREQIVEELERISASEAFRSKPVMRRLLSYLVKECIEGRSEQIKGYSIGVDVFGQGAGFDPDEGALVRNNAVRLRGLLKTYYLSDGKEDPVVIDIPKGRYVPRITENTVSSNENNAAARPGTADDPRQAVVAVLPLKNLSNDPALNFLASGFSHELSDALTKFDDLRVIGVSRFADGDVSADEISNKGIGFLVDGEIKPFQTRIKISYRLLNAADSSQLWGDSFKFDMELDNLFDIQERISGRIASLIGGEYGHVNQFRYQSILNSRPGSLDEQDILLKHYHHVTVLTDESRGEFYREVLAALEERPDSALLNAIAGGFYGEIWAAAGPGADEALREFARLTEKAYKLNPNHQVVLGNLGFKCFAFNERDRFFCLFEESEEWLAKSPLRLGGWAMHMCLLGEWERGKKLVDQVVENNLHVPSWLYGVTCLYYYRLRDYETALVEANKNRIPGLFWGPAYRTAVLAQLGRLAEAEKEFETLLECRPDFEEKGRRLMGCYIKEDSLLEHVFDGFAKIGKKITS